MPKIDLAEYRGLEGRWCWRKVSGKYARIEFYQVGKQVSQYQYEVFLEGDRHYKGRWGVLAVQGSLTNMGAEARSRSRAAGLLLPECTVCTAFPSFDPFKGAWVCKCGQVRVVSRKHKWYTCAECVRRFKSKQPEFICPECIDRAP